MSGLSDDGGINFNRKTNFGGNKKEEPKIEEPKIDPKYIARQIRLEQKLVQAKTVNYSGFAVNGGSIMTLLFGLNSIISDPNVLLMLN